MFVSLCLEPPPPGHPHVRPGLLPQAQEKVPARQRGEDQDQGPTGQAQRQGIGYELQTKKEMQKILKKLQQ